MHYQPVALEGQTRNKVHELKRKWSRSRQGRVAVVALGVFVVAMGVSVGLAVIGTTSHDGDRVTKTKWYPFTFLPKSRTEYVAPKKYGIEASIKHGIHIEYSRNGNIAFAGSFENGERRGIWHEFYYDGTPRFAGTYFEGQLMGKETWWLPNGQIEWTVDRLDGQRHGIEYWYHENGAIRRIGEFEYGEKEGPFVVYNDDGAVAFRSFYKKGVSIPN